MGVFAPKKLKTDFSGGGVFNVLFDHRSFSIDYSLD